MADPRMTWDASSAFRQAADAVIFSKKVAKTKRVDPLSATTQQGALARKVEGESEDFRHDRVDQNKAKEIRDLRTKKGWSQKQLAVAVNEKVDVVKGFENSTSLPNGALYQKLKRALK